MSGDPVAWLLNIIAVLLAGIAIGIVIGRHLS